MIIELQFQNWFLVSFFGFAQNTENVFGKIFTFRHIMHVHSDHIKSRIFSCANVSVKLLKHDIFQTFVQFVLKRWHAR